MNDGGADITARGVCWSTSQNPTSTDDCTSDGSGTGSFTSNLSNLVSDTQYYVRAYATNSEGTAYGSQLNFTTDKDVETGLSLSLNPVNLSIEPGSSKSTIATISRTDFTGDVTLTVMTVLPSGVTSSINQPNSGDSGTITFSLANNHAKFSNFEVRIRASGDGVESVNEFVYLDIEDGNTTIEIVDVYNPATGQTWMDRNLGASRAATSMADEQAYGDLYQWGRAADGHEKRNSGTTSTLSSSDQPGHGDFILTSSGANWDWRSPQNDNLWQGVNGINNPCPDGYRLPTEAEWNAERQSWSSPNRVGAFESPLKLPVVGHRYGQSGSLLTVGSGGHYWSSTADGRYAQFLYFFSDYASMGGNDCAYGRAVRCLMD